MSGTNLGWEILVGGDLGPLSKAILDVEKNLDGLTQTATQEVEKVEQAAKKAAQSVGKLGPEAVEALSKAGVAAERLEGAVLGVDGRVRDANGRFVALGAEGGAALRKLTGEAEKAERAIADVPAQAATGFGRLKAGLTALDTSLKGFQDTHKASIAAVGTVGLAAGGAFAGLAIEVGVAAKAFGDFEAVLNEIQAVAGVTGAEMDSMRALALKLGAETKFSAKEAAEGMSELAKAGFTAQQTMQAIPGVMALAAAGGVSVAQAAELAGGALRGFNLDASESGRVADLMAQAANKSAVGIGDLQLTMKYVAPVASSAGQSIEEMSAAIAIMGNNMIKGEQAGTTIRGALVRLIDPPKDAAEMLAKLGLSLTDTSGKMLPLSDIVEQLREKTAKMSEVQRSAALSAIFGTEALSGMMALVKASPEDYAAMTDAMKHADGASKQMADTMNKGLNASIEQMQGAIDTLQITIGEQFAPAIVVAANAIQNIAGFIAGLDQPTKALITGLGAGALAFTGLTAAAGALGLALPLVEAGVVALGLSISTALPIVGALSLAVGAAVVAAKSYADAHDAAAKATSVTSGEIQAQQKKVNDLAAEYANLKAKLTPTADEQGRMAAIVAEMERISPAFVTALDNQGRATDLDTAAILRNNEQAAEQLRLMKEREAQARKTSRANVASLNIQAQDITRQYNTLKAEIDRRASDRTITGAFGNPIKVAGEKGADIDALRDQLAALAEQRANVIQQRDDARNAFSKQYMTPDAKSVYGPAVPTGAAGRAAPFTYTPKAHKSGNKGQSKGKNAASQAAKKLNEWQKKQLAAMDDEYNLALLGAKTDDEEAQIKRTYIVDLELSGLDKVEAGHKKWLSLANDLKKYREQQEAQAKKSAEAAEKALNAQLTAQGKVRKGALADAIAQAKANADIEAGRAKQYQDEEKLRISKLKGLEQERAQIQLTYEVEMGAAADALTAAMDDARTRKGIADEQRQALKVQAEAAYTTRVEMANLARDKSLEEASRRWVDSLGNLGDSLLDIAQSDGWADLAAKINNIFSHPEKIEEWSESVQEALKALGQAKDAALSGGDGSGNAGGGLNLGDAASAAGVIGGIGAATEGGAAVAGGTAGASAGAVGAAGGAAGAVGLGATVAALGPFAAFVAGVQALFGKVGAELDKTYDGIEKVSDAAQQADTDIQARINSGDLNGSYDIAKARLTNEVGNLALAEQQLAKLKADRAADWFTGAKDFMMGEANNPLRIQEQQVEDAKQAVERLQKEVARYEQAQRDANDRDAADAAYFKVAKEAQDASAAAIKAASEQLDEASDRLSKVNDELDTGGRDSWGNKISLADERDLKIQEAMAALEEKRADALRREKQLTDDIAKINDDERRAIAAIENEGIAVRSESETQSKLRRIEDVKAEALAKRDAKTDEINGIEAQMKKEEEATAKAVSNIRILANERIKQLTDERTQLELNTKALQKQLDIQRQILAAGGTVTAPGGGTYSNSYNSSNTNFSNVVQQPGQTSWYTDSQGVVHYHDQGGTPVPPAGEGWATFKRGEFVLTPPQFNNLVEAAAGNALAMNDVFKRGALISPNYAHMAQASSAAQVNNFYLGGITIEGGYDLGSSRDRKALAQKLAPEINAALGGLNQRIRGGR